MSTHVWLVSEGEWSDYQVHCVFESEEEAERFCFTTNRREIKARHDRNVSTDYTPPNAHLKCLDPIESCPGCHDVWATGEWRLYVERRPYHPSGDVPATNYL